MFSSFKAHSTRILSLAWPIFIGQIAVIANSFIDTAMTARYQALDLAALAIGGAIYISVFVGLMGVVQALSPIVAQLYGAQKYAEIGVQVRQAIVLALILSALGVLVLWFPQPLLQLAQAPPELASKAIDYLHALAFALPAAMLFKVYSSLNTAVSRPRAVMVLQVAGLLLKIPFNYALMYGFAPLGLAAHGGAGCAIASSLIAWLMLLTALGVVSQQNFYQRFAIIPKNAGWQAYAPQWPHQRALLALGVPMGLSYFIEITAFTLMSIFIARLGTSTLAGHQITSNFGTILYMLPLSLAVASSTLVAQNLGAGKLVEARQTGLHGIGLTVLLCASVGVLVWFMRAQIIAVYTQDAVIASSAASLFVFIAFYQFFDAAQICAAFCLRAYKVATLPTVVYALALWGVGIGGGIVLGLNPFNLSSAWLIGASGFWAANSASLGLAAIAMLILFLCASRVGEKC
jgi:MATE family multidrug resistance protein